MPGSEGTRFRARPAWKAPWAIGFLGFLVALWATTDYFSRYPKALAAFSDYAVVGRAPVT